MANRARLRVLGERRKRLPAGAIPAGPCRSRALLGQPLPGRRRRRRRESRAPAGASPGELPGQPRSVPETAPQCPRLTDPVRNRTANSLCHFLSFEEYPAFPTGHALIARSRAVPCASRGSAVAWGGSVCCGYSRCSRVRRFPDCLESCWK